jgi:O-antigen ligase
VFWSEENAGWLFSLLSWSPSFGHAHNAYIDIWLDLGFLGLAVFLMLVTILVSRVNNYINVSIGYEKYWFGLSLLFVLIAGITEQTIMQQGTLEWVIVVTTLLYLSPLPSFEVEGAEDQEEAEPVVGPV